MAYDYTAFAGNTLRIVVTATDEAGDPLDLAGASLVYSLIGSNGVEVLRKTSADGDVTLAGEIVSDTATIFIAAGDTSALAGQRAYHELQCTDAAGNVSTLLAGWVTFRSTGIELEAES